MPLHRLPPYIVHSMIEADELAQVIDWGLAFGGVPDAWKVTRGEGIVVGVVDTGCQSDHPDLAGQLAIPPVDFTGSAVGGEDLSGHGTHVAGTVAGSDNQTGVVGVAPACKLVIAKGLGDDGSGLGEWIAAGVDHCVANGAHIVSMSLGSPVPDPFIHAAIKRAVAAGRIVICAAGNSGPSNPTDIEYPGRFEEVIAIAASNKDGKISRFSSRGPSVAFAFPGENILSCYPTNRYARLSGTSMACPFAAGAIALLLAKHRTHGGSTPVTTREHVIEHYRRFAKDVGEPGRDFESGWGIGLVGEVIGEQEPQPIQPVPGDAAKEYTYHIGGATFVVHVPSVLLDRASVTW